MRERLRFAAKLNFLYSRVCEVSGKVWVPQGKYHHGWMELGSVLHNGGRDVTRK